jgi:hypothetical protein
VDGRATLAEVLRQSQASEFLVLKFLYHLVHKQVLEILVIREPPAGPPTLLDEVEERPPETAEPRHGRSGESSDKIDVSTLADVARLLAGGLDDRGADPGQGSKR